MDYDSSEMRLARIFMPYAIEASARLQTSGKGLVHYTSAENAFKILKSKEFWLRRTALMNDYSEVWHGRECLWRAMQSEQGKKFIAALKGISTDVVKEANDLFSGWEQSILVDTYIGCLSEEGDEEAELGRLSMWRGYGSKGGVAIILDNKVFLDPNDHINAFTSPVAYFNQRDIEFQLDRIADNIFSNETLLKATDHDHLVALVFSMLRFALVCTKHRGFREETEWRIVHTVGLDEGNLKPTTEIIGGTPQPVVKIPLQDTAQLKIGIDFASLIRRIVIGPTIDQSTIWKALVMELRAAGINDAEERVFSSNIPLRI